MPTDSEFDQMVKIAPKAKRFRMYCVYGEEYRRSVYDNVATYVDMVKQGRTQEADYWYKQALASEARVNEYKTAAASRRT